MPSNRRLKVTGYIVVLTVLIVLYVTNGARNTYESPFYTRTVAAMQNRQDSQAREAIIAEEKVRSERVARIQEEHDKAMESKVPVAGDAGRAAGKGVGESKQKPMVEDMKEGAEHVKEGAKTAGDKVVEGVKHAQEAVAPDAGKTVAGRKKMPDGKVVVNEKEAGNDGVAKVGNTGAKESSVAKGDNEGPETEEQHKVEVELDSILKKGPIIIFSKSYCPFSKKAKVRLSLAPLARECIVLTFHSTSSSTSAPSPHRPTSSSSTSTNLARACNPPS